VEWVNLESANDERPSYLVRSVCLISGASALVSRGELGKVTVVVSLPGRGLSSDIICVGPNVLHFVVEDLGFSSLGLGDQAIRENIKDILANLLQLSLDLLPVAADCLEVLLSALGLFLLFNGRDDSPGSTTCADDVLVGDREQVAFVDSEFAANLGIILSATAP